MKFGVDYAAPAGANTLRNLKLGYNSFVCRYVSTVGNPKNITRVEASACKELGLEVVLVFETSALRALKGEAAGKADAISADWQAQTVGIYGLRKPVIYFAVDFDTKPSETPAIHAYLRGAQSVLKGRAGVYGGYWTVKRAFDAKIVKYGWQTYAWSGGNWDERAQLRQVKNGQKRFGLEVDIDQAVHPDFGQWPRPLIPRRAPVNKRKWKRWGRI